MAQQKNQHYVPQFYLKNFSDDKKTIGCYVLSTEKTYPQMVSLFRASSEPVTQILDSVNQKLKIVENKGVTILDSAHQELQSSPESII